LPLLIDIKPGDRVIINGAVLENAGAHTRLLLHNEATVLREKEVLSEEVSQTPASRVYFALQCAYLFADKRQGYVESFDRYLTEYVAAAPSAMPIAEKIRGEVAKEKYYKALKSAQELIRHENNLLSGIEDQAREIESQMDDMQSEEESGDDTGNEA